MTGKTQHEREAPRELEPDEMRTYIQELEEQSNNPLDHLELSINAKNQITGKVKIHYDGHDSRNKHNAFEEAMAIMRDIQRVNNPKALLSPQLLTDKED